MNTNRKFVILLEILVITFLVMSVVPVCGLSDFGSSDVLQDDFSFYAVYDRLLNSFDFTHAAMSGDGNKLIYFGRDKTSLIYAVYTVNTDGTGLTQIALPDLEGAGIGELAIDHDGSRAFFMAGGVFCKVENGVATKIFDRDDYPDIGGILSQIQTTADGGYVYFLDDAPSDNDVWRVAHSGGSPELVIDDVLVQRDGGVGKQVQEFAISDDGSTIVFALHGYAGESGYRSKCELFVRDATGGYRQLTNDDDDVWKVYPAISGDGSTIVFYVGSPQYKWYSIKSDGSAKIFLEDGGYNTGGPVLNYDGTKMFYNDQKANGGRLVNTDGSGGLDLFPVWNVVTIAARTDLCINDDGHRISFISFGSISIFPSDHVVYIGYLDNITAVPDAPIIESIAFDPPAMPRGDPDAVIVLTSEISAPQGLADIKCTITDELVDGRLERRYDNIPVRFYHAANDVGRAPDETAGDGIFSSAGTPAPKIDELDQMTVRMGVEDASGTVVVADTVLFIGEVPPTPTPVPTPAPTPTPTPPTTTQVPIDSTGSRTTVPPINVNGVDYAVVGVVYVDSPDSPLDAAGSELPQEVTVNLEELGLDYVETIYLATQNAWSFDMQNDVKVATLVCEYAEGGPPTTLDLIMGVNTAEWAWENPTQAAAFGAQPPHSMPPVITSTPTTGDSDQEYIAHTYAASVSLDPTRTLSNLRLELVDVNQLLAYRSPSYGVPALIAQACMAVTLEGRSATQIPTHISIDEAGKTVICEEEEDTSDGEFNCPIPIPNEASHIVEDYKEYWLTPNGFVGPYYTWYDTEKTKKRIFFCFNIEGELHGVFKWWHEDGTPLYEHNYKDGKAHGVCKTWSANGKLIRECNYEEGKCISCVHGHC